MRGPWFKVPAICAVLTIPKEATGMVSGSEVTEFELSVVTPLRFLILGFIAVCCMWVGMLMTVVGRGWMVLFKVDVLMTCGIAACCKTEPGWWSGMSTV